MLETANMSKICKEMIIMCNKYTILLCDNVNNVDAASSIVITSLYP